MGQGFRVDPDAVYDDSTLALGLGVTDSTLCRARRTGELRATRKGRQVLYRGQWVIDWLEHGSRSDRRENGQRP